MSHRFLARSFAAWLIVLSPLNAQTPPDQQAAFALFDECVSKIHSDAYRQEPVPVILSKALHALVEQLGDAYKAQDHDLAALTDDTARTAFQQAVLAIAATPGQRRGLRDLVESAIQAWCKQHDPYTRYTRSEDYKLVQLMNKTSGGGIGMSLLEKDGGFFCYPLPGSSAEAASIKPGDKLLSVDGKPVEGKPLAYIVSLVKSGPPGTEVMLRVERTSGRAQNLKVTRESITTPSVLVEKKITGYVLRVRKFSPALITEARAAVGKLSQGSTLTLDLRGCGGGDLDVGVAFAALFLEPGETIVTLRSRGRPDEVCTATKPREIKVQAITLLQDEGTASAAELLIAALMHSKSNHAVSEGPKTYGKGVFQDTYELRGGGHLALTTGEIIAPQGRGWEGIGLLPSLENRGRIFPKE